MRAMVLAAGFGTRLRPLTLEIPKPVVPVLGQPLCGFAIDFLRLHGVTEFLMNLHHDPDAVRKRVDAWTNNRFPLEYAFEPDILGTGGGIRNAREFLRSGTFIAANSDVIVRFPLEQAIARHRETSALATLVLFPDPSRRYTPVRIREDGKILGFGAKAPRGATEGFFTGCHIVEPELLEEIPPIGFSCIVQNTYAPLIAAGAPIFAFMTSGSFLDFGAPTDYLSGVISLLAENKNVNRSYVGSEAMLAASAVVGPDAAVESGASVNDGALVRRAIVWPGANVPPYATVENGILTPKVFVPA
ncbi:MAG: NDP-sugar synthase [Syntrophorhabdaceae bacterium]|nr:NDP-sugar synthase [Syntrophorhabdaceae bacterium]